MADSRAASPAAERRAQRLIALSFAVLAAYIGIEAVRDLVASADGEAKAIVPESDRVRRRQISEATPRTRVER